MVTIKDTSFKGLSFFGDMANEETNLFNQRSSWNKEDSLDEKYREFMLPHSKTYFSRLRPLYSFEIKKLASLNSFSHVLLRDGLLFLLRFFHLYPDPGPLQSKVFIHRDLAFTVPDSWKDHILLYETVSLGHHGRNSSSLKNSVVVFNLHEEQNPEIISQFIEPYLKKTSSLFIVPFFQVMRGEDFLQGQRAAAFQLIRRLVPDEAKIVDVDELGGLEAMNTSFFQINPQKTFSSDSALVHSWLSKGWLSPFIKMASEVEAEALVSLSPYHAVALSSFKVSPWQEPLKKRLFQQLKFPMGSLYQGEPLFNREIEDYYKIFYYSKNFLQFSKQMSEELARAKFAGGYF